jgi:hypothetical protein
MQDFTKIVYDMEYDIENDLEKRGFVVDYEKEEHITYKKEGIYIRIHYDSSLTDINGCPDSMRVYTLNVFGENLYLGKKPCSSEQLDNLFKNVYLESYMS